MPAIPPSPKYALPTTALLLSGGGARAAYQVGVLEAVSDLRRACYAHHMPNPFGVLAGTSAGSINATALACGADHFDLAVQRLASHWRALDVGSVYRADHPSLLRTGMHWLGMLALGLCLAYVLWAQGQGQAAEQFVPVTMGITAGVFGLAALVNAGVAVYLWGRPSMSRVASSARLPPSASP